MSGVERWRDSGHLERAVETAGSPEAFAAAVEEMAEDARVARLAEGQSESPSERKGLRP